MFLDRSAVLNSVENPKVHGTSTTLASDIESIVPIRELVILKSYKTRTSSSEKTSFPPYIFLQSLDGELGHLGCLLYRSGWF